ncbi:MAG: 2-oxo acid dehydrogenase subunit E2 [Lentisphaerae bacterium]|nr:2-oxo acid dehydrogenase subunit E2 [Lentisphaerota bacterium]
MAQAVIFPKLGQTAEEGAIVKWHKREGDAVTKGDILFEIETDKANLEVESFFEGKLLKVYIAEGITVPVNTVVGYVGEEGEAVPDQPPPPAATAAPTPAAAPAPVPAAAVAAANAIAKATPAVKPAAPAAAAPAPVPAAPAAPAAPARLIISPRAKALARDKAINPAPVNGSGPNGRITEKDIIAYLNSHNYSTIKITPAAKRLAQESAIDILTLRGSGDAGRIMVEDVERAVRCQPVALPRMRQVIARRLTESKQTIPHFYVTVTADITDLMALRSSLKASGTNYSVNDFILEAVVLSLEEFPVVNSNTNGTHITWRGDVDLGVAVSIPNGLVVPVVRAAQTLSMAELRDQVRALAEKARSGKLSPDEMSGSSFTVSNMGMLNVDEFSAIINPGEAGILAVASARPVPAVVNGEIRIRTRMAMTLSADHRIVDGATAAEFANAIRTKLENIELWKSLA